MARNGKKASGGKVKAKTARAVGVKGAGGAGADHDDPIVIDNGPIKINMTRTPQTSDQKNWKRTYTAFDKLCFVLTSSSGQSKFPVYLQAKSTVTLNLIDLTGNEHKVTFKSDNDGEIKVKTPKFKFGTSPKVIEPDGIPGLRITSVEGKNSTGDSFEEDMRNADKTFKYTSVKITIVAEDESREHQ
jgi:hypothetical protein